MEILDYVLYFVTFFAIALGVIVIIDMAMELFINNEEIYEVEYGENGELPEIKSL